MRYTTKFTGKITIDPPLDRQSINYLNRFFRTRRMVRNNGDYFASTWQSLEKDSNGLSDPDVINHNTPPNKQPSLWAELEISEDGQFIYWNRDEKTYALAEWFSYLIEHFFKEESIFKIKRNHNMENIPELDALSYHKLNGEIIAEGKEFEDVWKIIINNNDVYTAQGILESDTQDILDKYNDNDGTDEEYSEYLEKMMDELTAEGNASQYIDSYAQPIKLDYDPLSEQEKELLKIFKETKDLKDKNFSTTHKKTTRKTL